jgi:Ca-activated chloride channel family protein
VLAWLIPVAVVIAVAAFIVLGRGRAADLGTAQRAKRVAVVLMVGAVVLLVLGFTQFRFFRQSGEAATVALVLDVSESMSRDDVEPTRMQAAKEAARVFLAEAPEDMTVGLVTFGGDVQVLAEPTTDRAAIEAALVGLPRSEGTLIGDGLDRSIDVVAERWLADGEGPAAIVLLSDGRDTGSRVPPLVAAERAAREDIPVYTVVVGEALDDEAGANPDLLADIATTTDGEAYTATTASGLIDVYRTIQEQLVVALEISDFGAWFVGAAAIFAILATFAILYAIRAEMSSGATPAPRRVPSDVPRSRRPRTGRGRATRPRP